MEAVVLAIRDTKTGGFLLAQAGDEKIMVHQEAADFVIAEAAKGDLIEIHALEDLGRGPRARSATWKSRDARPDEARFIGEVTKVDFNRMFAFARPDGDTGDVFMHCTDFADYRDSRSDTFDALQVGDRVTGYCQATDRRPRGRYVESVP